MELPKDANKTAVAQNNPAADPEMTKNLSLGNRVSEGFEAPVEGGEPTPDPVPQEVNRSPASALSASDIEAVKSSFGGPTAQVKQNVAVSAPRQAPIAEDDAEAIRQAALEARTPKRSFYEVSAQLPDVDDKRTQQINDLSRKLKLPKEQVIGLLQSKTYEELNSTKGLEDVLLAYPGLYSWSQDPNNYKLLVKSPEQAKRIEDNSQFLKKAWDESSRLVKSNTYQLMQVSLHSMMSTGKLDLDKGVQKLQELDALIRENQTSVYQEGVQRFGESYKKMLGEFKSSGKEFNRVNFLDNSSMDDYLQDLSKIYKGVKGGAEGIGEVLATSMRDPGAFLIGVAGQSLYSMAPSIATGAATTAMTANPAIGLGAGVVTQAAISYGQFFQQESDKYRDPKTGIVDYRKMYQDPKVLSFMRRQGAKYAAAHAVFEYVAGKFIKTNMAAAKTEMAIARGTEKIKVIGKAAAKGVAASGLEEGAGEFVAQKAIGASTSDALGEAVTESMVGSLMGTGKVAVEYGVATPTVDIEGQEIQIPAMEKPSLVEKVKEYRRAKKVEAQAQQAVSQTEAIADTKNNLNESGMKDYKEQAIDLINEAATLEDVDTNGQVEEKPSTATLNINELTAYAEANGTDITTLVEALGAEASDAYYASVNNGSPDFTMTLAEFELGSLDFEGIEQIAYINDSEINGAEGLEITGGAQQVFNQLDTEIEQTLNQDEESNPDEPGPTVETVEGQVDADGKPIDVNRMGENVDPILRPIEVRYRGRSRDEMEVFQRVLKAIRQVFARNQDLTPEMAEVSTELVYQNLKFRSEMTGAPISELASNLTFDSKASSSEAKGQTKVKYDNEGIFKGLKLIFTPKASISTVVHELGHMFLVNMSEDYKTLSEIENKTAAQQEYWDAMQTMADKLGIPNMGTLSTLPEAQMKRAQETFAQTTEQYFIENKNPTGRMAKVMGLMRKWMSRVANAAYRAYKQYPTLKIDDDVRRLFNLILRAEEKATAEVDDIFVGPMFDPRMLGPNREAYEALLADARAEAIAKVYADSFNQSIEEREKLIDQELDRIYDNAREEVANSDEILFRDSIQKGDPDLRITYDSFLQVIAGGDENMAAQILALIPNKMVAGKKKAGMDIRQYMMQLGISDPAAMADFLMAGKMEEALVDQRADELIEEFFPPFKTDREIHQSAVEAVNGRAREDLIKMELKLLALKSPKKLLELASIVATPASNMNPEVLLNEAIDGLKAKATRVVNEIKVKIFKPAQLLATANRYGRRAAKYLAKGDFDAAFEMKEQEAMYFQAYRESLGAKRQVDNTTRLLKKYGTVPDRKAATKLKLDPDFIGYIKALGIALSTDSPLPPINVSEFRYGAKVESTFENYVNERIAAINLMLKDKNNADIAVREYKYLGEIIKASVKAARETYKAVSDEVKTSTSQTGQIIAEEIGARQKGDTTADMSTSFVAKLTADLQTIENFFAGLFPDEKSFANSTIMKVLGLAKNAEAVTQKVKDADWNDIEVAVKEMAKKDPSSRSLVSAIKKRMVLFRTGKLGKPVPAPEIDHVFANKGEVIMALAYYGSETGRRTLVEGGLSQDTDNIVPIGGMNFETGKYSSAKLEAFFQRAFEDGTITKEDMDFVQVQWDLYNRHFEAVKEAVRDVFGFDIGFIKPTPIDTPWGTYTGGYVPLVRTMTRVKSDEMLKVFTPDGMLNPVSDIFPFFTPGMAKERTGKAYPLSLDLTRLRSNLNSVYRVAYMMPTMWRVFKVFNEPAMRKAVESRRPGAMESMVMPWVYRTLSQKYSSEVDSNTFSAFSRVLQTLRRNQAVSAFVANYATWLKQFLGLFPAASIVGERAMMTGLLNAMSNGKQTKADIIKRSVVMERRFETNTTRGIDSFEDFVYNYDVLSNTKEAVEKATYAPIQFTQNMVDLAVFIAAETHAKTVLKLDDKAAVTYAEGVVERSQGTSSVSGRPAIMMTAGEYGRLITTFGSQVVAMFALNKSMRERNASKPLPKKLVAAGYVLGMTALLPGLFGQMISEGPFKLPLGDDDEDEEKQYAEQMALQAVKEAVDVSVPFIGNPMFTWAKEGPRAGLLSVPMFRSMDRLATSARLFGRETAEASEDLIDDNELSVRMSDKEYRDFIDSINLITGLPASAINKFIREAAKAEEAFEE